MTNIKLDQARTLIQTGDKPAAMELLAPIVDQEPQNLAAWALLADSCVNRRQLTTVLERCLAQNPGNAKVQAALDRIKSPQQATPAPVQHPHQQPPAFIGPKTKTKECPYCDEIIKESAKVCINCGKRLEADRGWYSGWQVKTVAFLFFTPLWFFMVFKDPESSIELKAVAVLLLLAYVGSCCWMFYSILQI
jgi:hypothetical protein